MTNPFSIALQAKGFFSLYQRARSIGQRYGLSASRMDKALKMLFTLLQKYHCGGTFPITSVSLARHSRSIQVFSPHNIEFAVHGYTHADYSRLHESVQRDHLQKALEIFRRVGLVVSGFRSPYLSQNSSLLTSLEAAGFSYISNQPLLFDVVDKKAFSSKTLHRYHLAVDFYRAWNAQKRVSTPRRDGNLIHIPVTLPDDEILVERLNATPEQIRDTWLEILRQTSVRRELFTLQIHPERTELCFVGLEAVLAEAHNSSASVWCARLDEISAWWRAREAVAMKIESISPGVYRFDRSILPEATVYIRHIVTDAPSFQSTQQENLVSETTFTFHSVRRPVIGVSSRSPTLLRSFLLEQGYLVENIDTSEDFAYCLDMPDFSPNQERHVIDQLEKSNCPLIWLNRWPNSARSAFAITGDIDALTLWDYILRLFGH